MFRFSKKWFDEVAADVIDGTSVFRIPSNVQKELKEKLDDKAPNNIPYLLIPGTLTNLASLTGSDVFIQDVVGAIEAGNSLQEITNTRLLSLYGLLNTSFADIQDFVTTQTSAITTGFTNLTSNLGTKISSLSTTLSGKLDSVDSSVDAMSSTLSKSLSDLKSLYSQYGNSTLSKLDALNTSIQAIDGFDLSADFNHLKELETQFGNATLNKLDSVIVSVDDISNAIFTSSQALSTHISTAFESGFDQISESLSNISVEATLPNFDDFIADSYGQLVALNSIADYMPDILSSIGILDDLSLEISAILDGLSSVFTSEDFSFALSDISLSAESLSTIDSSLKDYFSDFKEMCVDEYLQMYYDLMDLMITETSAITSVVDSYFYDLNKFLKTDVVGTLNDIKTSIQSIAGTTTAGPNPGGNNSQDEYEKKKLL